MRTRRFLQILFTLLIVTSSGFSQGTIRGVVVDSLERQPLAGANVSLVGTAFGASTNINGEYTILRIPDGVYILRISYIGYRRKSIQVTAREGKVQEVNAALAIDAIEGETVVITGQAQGQAGAINRQLSSATITNVVAADKIMELPDANAAESVGRLPGISVVRSGGEGTKVVIRGLSPTYNAITIAGDRIPATDLDDRSVDLSMIAPEILSGIEVTKALTPDKDADAFGGTVDFQLSTASHGGFKSNILFQSGYNHERDQFGEYKGRFFVSNRFIDQALGVLVSGNIERTQRGSDQFQASYAVAREMRPGEQFAPITTNSVTFEHTIDERNRYGFSMMLDYEISGGKIVSNNFISRLDRDEVVRTRRFDMSGSNKMKYYMRERQRQIDIITNTIGGAHDFNVLKLDWKLLRSAASTRYPYNSRFEFEEANAFNVGNMPPIRSPQDIVGNAYNRVENAYLYDGEVEPEQSYERDLSAQANIEWPFAITSDVVGRVKGGAKFREKLRERDRDYASKRLDITDSNFPLYHTKYGTPGFVYDRMPGTGYAYMKYYLDPGFDPGTFMDGTYDFGVGLDPVELDYFMKKYLYDDVYRFSLQRDLDDYSVTDRLWAGYLMTEINLGQLIMILPGVRYEGSNIDATGHKGIEYAGR
jgi:TonB-dependent receptor